MLGSSLLFFLLPQILWLLWRYLADLTHLFGSLFLLSSSRTGQPHPQVGQRSSTIGWTQMMSRILKRWGSMHRHYHVHQTLRINPCLEFHSALLRNSFCDMLSKILQILLLLEKIQKEFSASSGSQIKKTSPPLAATTLGQCSSTLAHDALTLSPGELNTWVKGFWSYCEMPFLL